MSGQNNEARKVFSWMLGGPKREERKKDTSRRDSIYRALTGGKEPPKSQSAGKRALPENRYRDGDFTGITRMGGVTYDLSIPHHRELYKKAQEADQATRPGQVTHDLRGGGGLKDDGSRHALPPNGNGRGTPAPDGGDGSGTQTSPRQMTMDEANALLGGGYKVVNPFSSNQLPDTSASPYFGQGKSPQYRSDVPEDTYDVQLSRNMTDGSPFNSGDYQYEVPTNTNIEYLQQAGSPKIPLSGAKSSSNAVEPNKNSDQDKNSGINWGARTAADNSDPNIARRRAFLDAPGSMQGLRRVESQKGIVYAGGKHHMVNPNQGQEGQSDFIAINKSDRDEYMRGDIGAQDLKSRYVKDIKESATQVPEYSTAPSDYKLTPGVDVVTSNTQRPAIEAKTDVLNDEVEYETPKPKFRGGRNAYQ